MGEVALGIELVAGAGINVAFVTAGAEFVVDVFSGLDGEIGLGTGGVGLESVLVGGRELRPVV